jgi:hypothetical protein
MSLKTIGTVLVILSFVVPADAQTQASMQTAVRKILETRLVDPSSLQFRNVRTVVGPGLCGEYNAKNRMGGYSGYQLFFYDPETATITNMDGDFMSDKNGDFSLNEFSRKKITSADEIESRRKTLDERTEQYKNNLMKCS